MSEQNLPDRVESIATSLDELHLQIRGRETLQIPGFADRLRNVEEDGEELTEEQRKIIHTVEMNNQRLEALASRQFALIIFTIIATATSLLTLIIEWLLP